MQPEAPHASLVPTSDSLLAYQRQALLGSTAAVIAHEFNNLMTPVLARAEYALLRNDVPMMRKALECVIQQTHQAMEVTRLLLELAEGHGLQPQACDLAEAVEDAVRALVRPLEKDGIRFEARVPESLAVHADPVLLRQVLTNLLLNARQAIGQGPGRVSVAARPEGGMICIEIRDTGCGIEPRRIDEVINPFLAADPLTDATDWQRIGLGLHACRLIVRQFGATLQAEANSPQGCTFRLRWPTA